ncbi:MAG: hypothetical protein J6I73_07725 [Treponema sp.]|nr:hypothetical protein [Treponema sp.]
MKLRNFVSKLWNDSVWSSVIASGIWVAGGSFIGLVVARIPMIRALLTKKIPFFVCFIEFAILLFAILFFIFLLHRTRKRVKKYDNDIEILKRQNNDLLSENKELKKEPANPRMKLFNNGDTVIIKNSDAYYNVKEFTVVGKDNNLIILIDNEGKEKKLSPDALLTAVEYKNASLNEKREIDNLLGINRNPRLFY